MHIYLQKAEIIFLIFLFIIVPVRCQDFLSILGLISHKKVTTRDVGRI